MTVRLPEENNFPEGRSRLVEVAHSPLRQRDAAALGGLVHELMAAALNLEFGTRAIRGTRFQT